MRDCLCSDNWAVCDRLTDGQRSRRQRQEKKEVDNQTGGEAGLFLTREMFGKRMVSEKVFGH